jgi:uncharacterized protein (DUF1501 family)
MSEQNEVQVEETVSNPYNKNKPWHTADQEFKGDSNGLFFEPQATSEKQESAAPEQKTKKQEADYKKRYDDLKKHYDQKISEFKQKELELQAAASDKVASTPPPKTAEELEQFKEKYPDLYDTVETVAQLRSEQQTEALRTKLSAIERREAEEGLRSKHPDFDELRGSDEFHEWAKVQPDQIQDWIYNNPNDVTLAIKAIDLYKLENNISTKPSKRKASKSQSTSSAADMVSTKTTNVDSKEPRVWSRREIAALSMDDYDKFEQEIDLAVREGRVRP